MRGRFQVRRRQVAIDARRRVPVRVRFLVVRDWAPRRLRWSRWPDPARRRLRLGAKLSGRLHGCTDEKKKTSNCLTLPQNKSEPNARFKVGIQFEAHYGRTRANEASGAELPLGRGGGAEALDDAVAEGAGVALDGGFVQG